MYDVNCHIKMCKGEELLLIHCKTHQSVYFMQKMYITINLGVQIHHGAVQSNNTLLKSFIEDGHKIRLK